MTVSYEPQTENHGGRSQKKASLQYCTDADIIKVKLRLRFNRRNARGGCNSQRVNRDLFAAHLLKRIRPL